MADTPYYARLRADETALTLYAAQVMKQEMRAMRREQPPRPIRRTLGRLLVSLGTALLGPTGEPARSHTPPLSAR
jgi:hypothetical protein